MMSARRGGRRLHDDERVLWKDVTRSIAPLRSLKESEPVIETRVATTRKAPLKTKPIVVAPAPAKKSPPPALAPLERRMKQRLARGTESIDGRLDLHGSTQAQAHDALINFLHHAQAKGAKNILVITGKGSRAAAGERGVLKRQVPLWLQLPEFRSLIVGFEQAHVSHGGEGALYVRVRRTGRR